MTVATRVGVVSGGGMKESEILECSWRGNSAVRVFQIHYNYVPQGHQNKLSSKSRDGAAQAGSKVRSTLTCWPPWDRCSLVVCRMRSTRHHIQRATAAAPLQVLRGGSRGKQMADELAGHVDAFQS